MEAMVKICPMCGHMNPVNEVFCEECDNDLSRVPVSTPNQPAEEKQPEAVSQPAGVPAAAPARPPEAPAGRVPGPVMQTGRRCRCGQVSPLRVMVCPDCGSSLAAAPIVRTENTPAPAPVPVPVPASSNWLITSMDNEASLNVTDGQHLLIGWAGELGSYFERKRKDYVSNRHGMLSVVRGELFFEDSSSNGTLINDRPIPKGQAQKLSAGDILCLGGRPGMQMPCAAYFRIEKR